MGKSKVDIAPIAVTILVIMLFWYISQNPNVINMSSGAGLTLLTLFPAMFVGFISLLGISQSKGYFSVPSVMLLGMSLCFFIGEADSLGLVSTSMLGGLTLSQVQIWIMAMSVLLGGALYTYKK